MSSTFLERQLKKLPQLSVDQLTKCISMCEKAHRTMTCKMKTETSTFKLITGVPTLNTLTAMRQRFVAELARRRVV